MLTITEEQRAAIAEKLTDENSEVIGNWMLNIQDAMSDAMRNGADWRYLLPLAAGTGRDHEQQRIDIILDWMWDALALVQPTADEEGFGDEWRTMCTERTPDAVANAAGTARYVSIIVHVVDYAETFETSAIQIRDVFMKAMENKEKHHGT